MLAVTAVSFLCLALQVFQDLELKTMKFAVFFMPICEALNGIEKRTRKEPKTLRDNVVLLQIEINKPLKMLCIH